jgi:hypothetical protein
MAQAIFFLVMLYMAMLGPHMSGSSPLPAAAAARRNCPDKCGDVTVPYPFGIGPDCSLPNFSLSCKSGKLLRGNIRVDNITLEPAQIVAYLNISHSCDDKSEKQDMAFNLTGGPFLISPADNVFTAIGCSLVARLSGRTTDSTDGYLTGCITTCTSVNLNDTRKDGAPCSGQGCCQASIAAGLTQVSSRWKKDEKANNSVPNNRCQYTFVAQKGWYVQLTSLFFRDFLGDLQLV